VKGACLILRIKGRFAIRTAKFGPETDTILGREGKKLHETDEMRGSFERAIRIPLRPSLFLFNDLEFLRIPRKSLKFLSFAKTPQQLNVIHVTCYTTSSYVIHFKCVPNSGEGQLGGHVLRPASPKRKRKELDQDRSGKRVVLLFALLQPNRSVFQPDMEAGRHRRDERRAILK
jgi:hypothetical protein